MGSSVSSLTLKAQPEITLVCSVPEMAKHFYKESIIVWFNPNPNPTHNGPLKKELEPHQEVEEFSEWQVALKYIKETKLICFVLLSTNSAESLIKEINDLTNVPFIYFYYDDPSLDLQWKAQYPKVLGTEISLKDLIDKSIESIRKWQQEESSLKMNLPAFAPEFDENDKSDLYKLYVYLKGFMNFKKRGQAKKDFLDLAQVVYPGYAEGIKRFAKEERKGDMRSIFYWYTRNDFFYRLINNLLRIANSDSIQFARFGLKEMEEAIRDRYNQKSKNFSGLLYRGTYMSNEEWKALGENLGKEVEMLGFLSTTKVRRQAERILYEKWDQKAFVTIVVPPAPNRGEHGFAEIEEFSDFPAEGEILFNIHSKFTVLRLTTEIINKNQCRHLVLLYGKKEMMKDVTENCPSPSVQIRNKACAVCKAEITSSFFVNLENKEENICRSCQQEFQKKNTSPLLSLSDQKPKSSVLKIEGLVMKYKANLNIRFYGYKCIGCQKEDGKNYYHCISCNHEDDKIWCEKCNVEGLSDCAKKGHMSVLETQPYSFWKQKMPMKQAIYLNYQRGLWEDVHIIGQGNTFWHAEDFKKALEYCERVQERRELEDPLPNGRHPLDSVYRSLGNIHEKMQNHKQAEKSYVKFLQKLEQYPDKHQEEFFDFMRTNLYLSRVYQNQGQYDKAKECIQQAFKVKDKAFGGKEEHVNAMPVFEKMANLFRSLGRFQEAKVLIEIVLTAYQQEVGEQHPIIAVLHCDLAILNQDLCLYSEARKHFEIGLEITQSIFGEKHSATFEIRSLLNLLDLTMGDNSSAEKALESSLNLSKSLYGEENMVTAAQYARLAEVYQKQCRYGKAEEYLLKALKIGELKAHSEKDNAQVIGFENNLGNLYTNMNKLGKAEVILLEALKKAESLGKGEPTIRAWILNNLGQLYLLMKKEEESVKYLKEAFEVKFELFGENHLETANAYNHLGGVYQESGNDKKALEFFEKALKVAEELVPNHLDIAIFCNNIAVSMGNLNKHEEAYKYHKKALKIKVTLFGEANIESALSFCNLGKTCTNLGKYSEAHEYLNKSQKFVEGIPEHETSHLLVVLKNQSVLSEKEGRIDEGIKLLKKIYSIQRKSLGEKDVETIKTCVALGDAHSLFKDYGTAEKYFLQALPIIPQIYKEKPEELFRIYNQLAGISHNLRKPLQETEKYMKEVLKVIESEQDLGKKESLEFSHAYYNIGRFYAMMNQLDKAIDFLNKSLKIRLKKSEGKKDEYVASSYQSLGEVFLRKNDLVKAKDHFEDALLIRMEVFGGNSPVTMNSFQALSHIHNLMGKKP